MHRHTLKLALAIGLLSAAFTCFYTMYSLTDKWVDKDMPGSEGAHSQAPSANKQQRSGLAGARNHTRGWEHVKSIWGKLTR
jgi:hypothetical protein